MNCQFGIDLGNSTVCLAVHKDSNVDVVANKAGERVTPTILAMLDKNEFVVGEPARQRAVRNPGSTVTHNLQFCRDISDEELEQAKKSISCKIESSGAPLKYCLEIEEDIKDLTPFDVNIEIFKNVLSSAHQMCHGDDENAEYPTVIAIPDYFTQDNAKQIGQAAEIAGLKVEQIITNAAAAALAYNIGQESTNSETILVYRIGGLTSECTLLHVENGMYEIENTIHHNNLGGYIFTKALADFVAEEFFRKYKLNPKESRRHMAKLIYYTEHSKHILSSLSSTHIFIESLIDGVDVNNNISRARFESLIAPHLSKFRKPIEEILETRKNKAKSVDRVILCGGSMKIPKLQSAITEMFPNSEILSSISPDEVIAIGSARQAALNPGKYIQDAHFAADVDVIPHDIYIKQIKSDDEEILAFPQGTQVYSVFRFNKTIAMEENDIAFNVYEKRGSKNAEEKELGVITFSNSNDGDKIKGEIEFIAILKPTLVEITYELQQIV